MNSFHLHVIQSSSSIMIRLLAFTVIQGPAKSFKLAKLNIKQTFLQYFLSKSVFNLAPENAGNS